MTGTTQIAEAVERAAWTDLFEAAPPELRDELALEVVGVGRATALVARCGGILLNRALGARPQHAELEALAALYQARGIDRFFVHLYDGDEERVNQVAWTAGLVRYPRAWVKMLRADPTPPPAPKNCTIRVAHGAEAVTAGRIFADAFDLPPAFAGVIAALADRPRWRLTVASEGSAVAGMGLLFMNEGIGYLAGGATAPQWRRRGVQGAIMAERVRAALAGGCRWIATETGEAAPGDAQHSYRNMVRCGFSQVGLRHNFAPAGTSWLHGRDSA